jgi:hypothetical protein
MKPRILIDENEMKLCAAAANQRHANGRKNNRNDVSTTAHSAFKIDLIGVCGEVALIKYFGMEIDWHDIFTAFGTTDVGECWEVRSVTQPHYHLAMWNGGGANETKIKKKLMSGWSKIVVNLHGYESAVCYLDGWAFGYDIRDFGYKTTEGDSPFQRNRIKRPSLILDNFYLRKHSSPQEDMKIVCNLRKAFQNK